MNVLEAIETRRSERFFTEEIVSQEQIEILIDAALLAPTSCNMQVFNLTLVNDSELLKKFSINVTGKVNWCKQLFVLSVDPKLTFENQANLISAGMVVQNLLLAAVELGLATCPIAGFGGKDFIRKSLNIPKDFDIPLLIFIGVPADVEKQERAYRKDRTETLGINRHSGERPFPKSSNIKFWSQNDIERYRERILSVYFPRLRHGNWPKGLSKLWAKTEEIIEESEGSILYIFPTETEEFDMLDRWSDKVCCADVIKPYVKFLNQRFCKASLLSDTPNETYKSVFLHNKLMFQKDLDSVFKFVYASLDNDGVFYLSIFNKKGIVSLMFSLLKIFGKQRDVYHNASFYKYGPFRFVEKSLVIEKSKLHNLDIIEIRNLRTFAIFSKLPKQLHFIARLYSRLIPETLLFKMVRKK